MLALAGRARNVGVDVSWEDSDCALLEGTVENVDEQAGASIIIVEANVDEGHKGTDSDNAGDGADPEYEHDRSRA